MTESRSQVIRNGLFFHRIHVHANRGLIAGPNGFTSLVGEGVVPAEGGRPDGCDGDRGGDHIPVSEGGMKGGRERYDRKPNPAVVDERGVGNAAHGLPRLLKHFVRQIKDSWVVGNVGHVDHGELNRALNLNRHTVSTRASSMNPCFTR